MKKITPYFSDSNRNNKLQESNSTESFSKRNKVNESYDDLKEIYTDRDIAKVISKAVNSSLTVLIGQERGNQLVPTIEEVCDNLEIEAASISCRSIRENRSLIDSLYEAPEDLILITDFEIADPRMLSDLAAFIQESEGKAIVCTSTNPYDLIENPMFSGLFSEQLFYVPQYDRMSYYNDVDESVSQRFAKYRKLYEDESVDISEEDDENKSDDSEGSDEGSDDSEDSDENQSDDSEESNDEDETVDVPMTAVVLTVKKEDADKCKDELIEAGIPEDNIEIIEGEDDEDSQIKVDADSVKELKDYLAGKGIDLEEKIGGEIIDDEESSEESSDDEGGEDDKASDEGGEDDFNFDDEFGDLFGDEEESSDDK